MTLGRSFLVWLLGVLVATLVLVSALVLWHEQRILDGELQARAEIVAHLIGLAVAGDGASDDLELFSATDVRAAEVRSGDGQILWRFGPAASEAELLDADLLRVERRVSRRRHGADDTGAVHVVVLVSRSRVRAHLAAAAVRLLAGLGIALALALAYGLALVGRDVRPLHRLAAWARTFDPELPMEPPLEGSSPAEVSDLAQAFRDMAGRLIEQRRSLVASEKRFRELFAASPTPLIRIDSALAIRDANPAAEPFLPGGSARAVGRALSTFVDLPAPDALAGVLAAASDLGESTLETGWRLEDGTVAEVELRFATMGGASRGGILVAIHDLTDQMRRMGERWRRTFDAMMDGVALVDAEGRIVLANRALEPHQAAVSSGLLERTTGSAPGRWRTDNVGRVLECSLSFPEGLEHAILVVRDVTEAVDAEERVRAAEKMQAVGTLAAGVAHDFNNLLAGVLLHARLLERRPDAAAEAAAAISALAREGAEVVNELLYFARREGAPPSTFDLSELVRRQDGVLRHLLTDDVGLELDLDPDPVPVSGDPVGLRRLLLNLVLNAREAVRESGGRVAVRVEHAAGRAVLEVADDGPGIPPENQERLFEPFFTSRRHGRGAGLGLAVVYSIVTAHDGEIDVRSRKGEGTRFIVRLPLADGRPLESLETVPQPVRAGSKVLVVAADGRVAARIIEAVAAAGAEARHAPTLADAAEMTEGWSPQAAVVIGHRIIGSPPEALLRLPALLVVGSHDPDPGVWGPQAVGLPQDVDPEALVEVLRDIGYLEPPEPA
jgi:PAS domain S-box-containing protein